jgi:hypothetical protein
MKRSEAPSQVRLNGGVKKTAYVRAKQDENTENNPNSPAGGNARPTIAKRGKGPEVPLVAFMPGLSRYPPPGLVKPYKSPFDAGEVSPNIHAAMTGRQGSAGGEIG